MITCRMVLLSMTFSFLKSLDYFLCVGNTDLDLLMFWGETFLMNNMNVYVNICKFMSTVQ